MNGGSDVIKVLMSTETGRGTSLSTNGRHCFNGPGVSACERIVMQIGKWPNVFLIEMSDKCSRLILVK